jgi:predicted transcriptional regulator
MSPYYSRPDLLPGIHEAIYQKPGQTLREIARQNSCHVETIKATIKDEFQVYKTKTSHYVFPLNFAENPETFR